MEILLLFWLVCGIAAGMVASSRGRSGCGWMLVGFLFGPLGLLAALVMPAEPGHADKAGLQNRTKRRCPECAEVIQAEARKCRFCGADVEPERFDLLGRKISESRSENM